MDIPVSIVEDGVTAVNETEESYGMKVSRITLEELEQKQELQKTLTSISKTFDINNTKKEDNTYERVDATDGSFTILTDEIVEVLTDSTTTYTFKVEIPTDANSTFENFIIDQACDSIYHFYIYKYVFDITSEQEFPYTVTYDEIDENLIEITNFNNVLSKITTDECVQVTYGACSSGGTSYHTEALQDDGSFCTGTRVESIDIDLSCGGSGGYSGTTGTGTTGTGTTGTGGTSGGSTTGPGTADPSPAGVIPEDDLITMASIIVGCLGDPTATSFDYTIWLNDPTTSDGDRTAMANYLQDNHCSKEASIISLDFMSVSIELPNAIFERYIELIDLLEINPWALIEDCAQENGLDIANYQLLYDHNLPSACVNRLNVLGDEFQNQPIETGNAAVANVDYYGVEVTTNPDFNNDGAPDTDAEVYDEYRVNFGDLASGSQEDFQFSCNAPWITGIGNTASVGWEFAPFITSDYTLWLSDNPLTTIFEIDAWADGFPFAFIADDGAIMISAFTNRYWIGSTIQTEDTGTQPFSGNRQWGYHTNLNGNLELYARAVDVARIDDFINTMPTSSDSSEDCQEDTYYNIGEATWSNLQSEINQWIIDNGGISEVIPKTAIRFDKTKLKELLESNETIGQISCN